MQLTYITPVVFEHARVNANKPAWARVYKTLNEERIQNIVLDGKTFWFEHNMVHEPVSDSVYETIKDFLKSKQLTYLYDN